MPETPEQLPLGIDELPHEAMHGGAPAGAAELDEAKKAFYDAINDASPTPPMCLPDHGVHVFAWSHRRSGPCLCTSKRSAKGDQ